MRKSTRKDVDEVTEEKASREGVGDEKGDVRKRWKSTCRADGNGVGRNEERREVNVEDERVESPRRERSEGRREGCLARDVGDVSE